MLKQREILEATKIKLKELYDLPVYLDEVKENFITPCFFLKLIKHTKPYNIQANKNQNDCLLIITYIGIRDDRGEVKAVDLYDVKDSVTAAFWRGMAVGKRWIHFAEITADTDGEEAEIVYIQLPFTYFDSDDGDKEAKYIIENIYQMERLKGKNGGAHCEPQEIP